MKTGELKAAIARKGITNREIAATLHISEQAFYNKVNGLSEFKGSEIKAISRILNLTMDDVNVIFFADDVN